MIEEEFFKTFGIEPKYQDTCIVEEKYWGNEELANEYGTFDMYMNAKCGNQENCTTECSCAYQKEIYPPIAGRILLELICILGTRHLNIILQGTTIKQLKECILSECIKNRKCISEQVRKLFESEEE